MMTNSHVKSAIKDVQILTAMLVLTSEAWTVCSLVSVFDSAQIYKLFRCDRLHPPEEEQAQWKFTESEMKQQMICYIPVK